MSRPKFCYDESCEILLSTFDEKSYHDGVSFFCFGKLKERRVFKEKDTVHENDISHCYYTPLKGMIRFFMNVEDLWGEANAWLRVLNKLKDVKCPDCGKKMNKTILHLCLDQACIKKTRQRRNVK